MVERNEDTEYKLVQAIDEDADGTDYEEIMEDEDIDEDRWDDMDGHDTEAMIEDHVAHMSDETFQESYKFHFGSS